MSTLDSVYNAVRIGNIQTLQNALTQGPRPTRRELYELLALAVMHNNIRSDPNNRPQRRQKIIKALLKYGAPINMTNNNSYPFRYTPLQFAIRNKENTIVKLLLDRGADPNRRNHDDGYTPLHVASIIPNNATIIRHLIERGANVDAKTLQQHYPVPFLDVYSNPDQLYGTGLTSLHLATHAGIENTRVLVDVGKAKVNVKSSSGISPLHASLYNKVGGMKEEIIRFLIDRGAHINAKDSRGFSPLHIAALQGEMSIIKILLENGAIPFIQNSRGRTPVDLASNKKVKNMIHMWPGERSVLRRMASGAMNSTRNRNTGKRIHVPSNIKQRILSQTGLFNRNQFGRPSKKNMSQEEIRNAWRKEEQIRKKKRKRKNENQR
jgi:ankyrin repeat protein